MTNKIDIQKRLHHRHPYLLIDEVVEHSSKHLHARKLSTQNDFFQAGHFPGAPVVPGAMMQEMTTQAAGLLIAEYYSPVADYDSEKTKGFALGVLRAIHQAKYKKFARPQDELDIKVELIEKIESSFYFKAHVEVAGIKVMSNEFTLVNISEEKLIGD
jgi:3-hydroxyacyl-[acyl-carrier-protein] dehydratase